MKAWAFSLIAWSFWKLKNLTFSSIFRRKRGCTLESGSSWTDRSVFLPLHQTIKYTLSQDLRAASICRQDLNELRWFKFIPYSSERNMYSVYVKSDRFVPLTVAIGTPEGVHIWTRTVMLLSALVIDYETCTITQLFWLCSIAYCTVDVNVTFVSCAMVRRRWRALFVGWALTRGRPEIWRCVSYFNLKTNRHPK